MCHSSCWHVVDSVSRTCLASKHELDSDGEGLAIRKAGDVEGIWDSDAVTACVKVGDCEAVMVFVGDCDAVPVGDCVTVCEGDCDAVTPCVSDCDTVCEGDSDTVCSDDAVADCDRVGTDVDDCDRVGADVGDDVAEYREIACTPLS